MNPQCLTCKSDAPVITQSYHCARHYNREVCVKLKMTKKQTTIAMTVSTSVCTGRIEGRTRCSYSCTRPAVIDAECRSSELTRPN